MFVMKIEKQMNIKDRTLLLGVPKFDAIPKSISIDDEEYKVIGVSQGVKPPFVSLEIEKMDKKAIGKEAVA